MNARFGIPQVKIQVPRKSRFQNGTEVLYFFIICESRILIFWLDFYELNVCLMIPGEAVCVPPVLLYWRRWFVGDFGPVHQPHCHPVSSQKTVCRHPQRAVWQQQPEHCGHEVTGRGGGATQTESTNHSWCGGEVLSNINFYTHWTSHNCCLPTIYKKWWPKLFQFPIFSNLFQIPLEPTTIDFTNLIRVFQQFMKWSPELF